MHPNPGQTALADAIADAVAKATGLHPAAPYHGPAPYPTNRLTPDPVRPPRPPRTRPQAAPHPRRASPRRLPAAARPPRNQTRSTGPASHRRSTAPLHPAPRNPLAPTDPPLTQSPMYPHRPKSSPRTETDHPRPATPDSTAAHPSRKTPVGRNHPTTPTRPGTGPSTRSPAPTTPRPAGPARLTAAVRSNPGQRTIPKTEVIGVPRASGRSAPPTTRKRRRPRHQPPVGQPLRKSRPATTRRMAATAAPAITTPRWDSRYRSNRTGGGAE